MLLSDRIDLGTLVRVNDIHPSDDPAGEVVGMAEIPADNPRGKDEVVSVQFQDGTRVSCRPDQVEFHAEPEFYLDSPRCLWRVRPNPYGGGLMLLADIGPPEEGRTQVVSRHADDELCGAFALEAAVKAVGPKLATLIGRFEALAAVVEDPGDVDRIGLMVGHYILGVVAAELERSQPGGGADTPLTIGDR